METRQVRYFLAVCETLDLVRAAELCGVAQPQIAGALAQLEKELGGRLVAPDDDRLALTDLGHAMRPHLASACVAARSSHAAAER